MAERHRFGALLKAIADAQYIVLRASYVVHRVARRGRRPNGYVIGMEEIAGLLSAIGSSLDGAVTVNLGRNHLYDHSYDIEFNLRGRWALLYRLRRLVVGPWILGRLAARHETFIYLGAQGFLISVVDGRERELGFLRSRGRTVVCYFTGSEIRSHVLLNAFAQAHDIDVITTYQPLVAPGIASAAADDHRRALAQAADRHAHVLINAAVDQMSYLERRPEPALYFCPDHLIRRRPEKWGDLSRPLIMHAPTSPIIKGTPLARAAIKALRSDGYDFEYVELLDQPHAEVLATLERAHIVLNQFYGFVPTILGVEAMASNAVLVTSADAKIETTLPAGANDAWVVTPYWRVYDNLKRVLDDPSGMQAQADRGTAWAATHCSRSANRKKLLTLLGDLPR